MRLPFVSFVVLDTPNPDPPYSFEDICSAHGYAHAAGSCTACGGPSEPGQGVILERLYPGALFCSGCGRRVVACDCREVG